MANLEAAGVISGALAATAVVARAVCAMVSRIVQTLSEERRHVRSVALARDALWMGKEAPPALLADPPATAHSSASGPSSPP